MRDSITAWLRTAVPTGWLFLVGLLLQWWAEIPQEVSSWLSSPVTIAVVSFLVIQLWYGIWKLIEPYIPTWLGTLVFGNRTQPTYLKSSPPNRLEEDIP